MVQLGYENGTQGLYNGSLKKIEASVCNHYHFTIFFCKTQLKSILAFRKNKDGRFWGYGVPY